jgi:hypothetical protein
LPTLKMELSLILVNSSAPHALQSATQIPIHFESEDIRGEEIEGRPGRECHRDRCPGCPIPCPSPRRAASRAGTERSASKAVLPGG